MILKFTFYLSDVRRKCVFLYACPKNECRCFVSDSATLFDSGARAEPTFCRRPKVVVFFALSTTAARVSEVSADQRPHIVEYHPVFKNGHHKWYFKLLHQLFALTFSQFFLIARDRAEKHGMVHVDQVSRDWILMPAGCGTNSRVGRAVLLET